jgi:hypothetical protein
MYDHPKMFCYLSSRTKAVAPAVLEIVFIAQLRKVKFSKIIIFLFREKWLFSTPSAQAT